MRRRNVGGSRPTSSCSGKTLYGTAGGQGSNTRVRYLPGPGAFGDYFGEPHPGSIVTPSRWCECVQSIDEVLRSVRLDGGSPLVAPAASRRRGSAAPRMVPSLAPGASVNFTYFTGYELRRLTFTARATGLEPECAVTRTCGGQRHRDYRTQGGLMVKSADPGDTAFGGVDEFQPVPPFQRPGRQPGG